MSFVYRPPAFPVGFRVSVGYMGLAEAGKPACTRNGSDLEPGNGRVVSLRLVMEEEERSAGKLCTCGGQLVLVGNGTPVPCHADDCATWETEWVDTYPRGWEYLVLIGDREHGWYTETELIKAGYAPPATPLISRPPTAEEIAELQRHSAAPLTCEVCRQVIPQTAPELVDAQILPDVGIVCEGCTRAWAERRQAEAAAALYELGENGAG